MAKKRKSALFTDVSEQDNNSSVAENSSLSAIVDSNNESDNESAAESLLDIDELGALRLEVKRLNEENAQLTDKLAAYIEAQQDSKADDSCISAELDKLRYENNALRDENDTYLMKISELTFENAKLMSQLQQLSKDTPEVRVPVQTEQRMQKNSSQKVAPTIPSNVPYVKANGYQSWN